MIQKPDSTFWPDALRISQNGFQVGIGVSFR